MKNLSGPTISGCFVTAGASITISLDAARMGGEDVTVQPFDTNVSSCANGLPLLRVLPQTFACACCWTDMSPLKRCSAAQSCVQGLALTRRR